MIHSIDPRFTTPTLDYRSDGTSLIWSSSAADGPTAVSAADLWKYTPGGAEPERIFVNPNRDSRLDLIAGDGDGHFAFLERNERVLGDSGWQLWFLAEPGGTARLLDASDEASETVPLFALDDARVVWATVHQATDGPRSELLMWQLGSEGPVVLEEGDPDEISFAFPDLLGDELVYSAFELQGGDPAAQEFRIYRRDLSDPDADPERLDTSGDVAMPVLGRDVLVWKVAPQNAYGWGNLIVMDADGRDPLKIDTQSMHTDRELAFNYPSLGDDYLAALDPNHNSLYVFDVVNRRPLLVEDLGEERLEGERDAVIGRPDIAGRLLAYVQGSDDQSQPLTLKYVELPAVERDGD